MGHLKDKQGFEDRNITVLMDDGYHQNPTYSNIMNAYREVCMNSMSGDTVFLHYSGHGGHVRDTSGDEDDGFDETLIPVDYQSAGQIVDDDLCEHLVKAMPAGVLATSLMDCCHSGTVLDLPYTFTAKEMEEKQQYYKNYKELIEGYENDNGEHVDMSQPRDASYAEFKWDDDLKKEVLLKTHRLGSNKPLKSKLKGNMKMKNPYTYRDIPSEVRGITLRQLKAIIPMIKRRCDEEEWTRPTFSNGVKTDGVE